MVPQTETKAGAGFKAGVKDYRLTYYTPGYVVRDTDKYIAYVAYPIDLFEEGSVTNMFTSIVVFGARFNKHMGNTLFPKCSQVMARHLDFLTGGLAAIGSGLVNKVLPLASVFTILVVPGSPAYNQIMENHVIRETLATELHHRDNGAGLNPADGVNRLADEISLDGWVLDSSSQGTSDGVPEESNLVASDGLPAEVNLVASDGLPEEVNLVASDGLPEEVNLAATDGASDDGALGGIIGFPDAMEFSESFAEDFPQGDVNGSPGNRIVSFLRNVPSIFNPLPEDPLPVDTKIVKDIFTQDGEEFELQYPIAAEITFERLAEELLARSFAEAHPVINREEISKIWETAALRLEEERHAAGKPPVTKPEKDAILLAYDYYLIIKAEEIIK